jgi:DNA invertase Pin-like site-specific DNA recombinase
MLDRIAGNGVRTIIVESPDRFGRDLAVQLAGHDFLKNLGVSLVPASAPDFFLEDTPTAVTATPAYRRDRARFDVMGLLRALRRTS